MTEIITTGPSSLPPSPQYLEVEVECEAKKGLLPSPQPPSPQPLPSQDVVPSPTSGDSTENSETTPRSPPGPSDQEASAKKETVSASPPPLTAEKALFGHEWLLYWHDKNDHDWSLKSYKKKGHFRTVADFYSFYNNLRSVAEDMLFLMRAEYPPLWEDPQNINGGALCFKIYKKDADNFWLTASEALVGETVCDFPDEIVGLSISPKGSNQTVRLWFRQSSKLPNVEKTLNPVFQKLFEKSNSNHNDGHYIIRHHRDDLKALNSKR